MSGRERVVRALLAGKPGGPHPGGIAVYHSSPYDFDKFDWSKLRTGEGSNTYGAGLYMAENPLVSGRGGEYWQQFSRHPRFSPAEAQAATELHGAGFDREKAIQQLRQKMKEEYGPSGMRGPVEQRMYMEDLDALDLLHSNKPVGPRTYEVNIAARPELMLDWDKPMKAQPLVSEAIAGSRYPLVRDVLNRAGTGENFYRALTHDLGSHPRGVESSEKLADAGIPGIRYLDQGSRPNIHNVVLEKQIAILEKQPQTDFTRSLIEKHRAEQAAAPPPTYNYVVTDPSKLDILAKYGVVGTAGGGLSALAAQDQYGSASQ